MPMSPYMKELRSRVGTRLILMPSVTGLVFDSQDRVLLVRHSNGNVWVAPGGAIDPDEPPQDAVVRELWEETGLSVEPVRLRGVFGGPEFLVRYENGDQVGYVMAVYECRVTGGTLRADGEETLEARYVGAADLASLKLADWARVVLPPLMMDRSEKAWIPPVKWKVPT